MDELHAAKALHQVYDTDLRMHRQIKENTELELSAKASQAKSAESKAAEWQQKHDKVVQELKDKEAQLRLQEDETRKSLAGLEKVTVELDMMRSSRDVLLKQWEAAVGAMQKRDIALKALVDERNKTLGEKKLGELEVRSMNKQVSEMGKEKSEIEKAQERDRARLTELSTRLAQESETREAQGKDLAATKQQLDAVSETLKGATAENARLADEVSHLKKKLTGMNFEVNEWKKKFHAVSDQVRCMRAGMRMRTNRHLVLACVVNACLCVCAFDSNTELAIPHALFHPFQFRYYYYYYHFRIFLPSRNLPPVFSSLLLFVLC